MTQLQNNAEAIQQQKTHQKDFDEFFALVEKYSADSDTLYHCEGWKGQLVAIIKTKDFERFDRAVIYMTGSSLIKISDEYFDTCRVYANGYWQSVGA